MKTRPNCRICRDIICPNCGRCHNAYCANGTSWTEKCMEAMQKKAAELKKEAESFLNNYKQEV